MPRTTFPFRLLPTFALVFIMAMLGVLIAPNGHAVGDQQVTVGVGLTTLTISGQTSPSAFVTVRRNTSPIGSTSADSSGNFSLTINFEDGGIYQLSMYATTPGGAVSDPLTASINVVDHEDTLFDAFLPPTISLESSQVAVGQAVRAFGETIPNGTITVTTDLGTTTQAHADPSGHWSTSITATTAGARNLFAASTDGLGQQSAPTRRVSYIVTGSNVPSTTPAPITPISPSPSPRPIAPVITSPQDNQYMSSSPVIIRGTAVQGSLIELWDATHNVGSVYASSDGSWQISYGLTAPHSVLRARTCRFGTCSDFSSPINIFFSPGLITDSLYSELTTSTSSLTGVTGNSIKIPLLIKNGAAPYEVTIDWGDTTIEHETYAHEGTFKLTHVYAKAGQYNGTITVRDSNDVEIVHHFAVKISDRKLSARIAQYFPWIVVLTVALFIIRYVIAQILSRRRNK